MNAKGFPQPESRRKLYERKGFSATGVKDEDENELAMDVRQL